MQNQLISALTGLGVVTTPVVALYFGVAGLNLVIANADKIKVWVGTKPKLSAVVGILEGAGFDPLKTAMNVRNVLKSAEKLES